MAESKSYGIFNITDIHFGEYWELPMVYQDSAGVPIDITGERLYGEFRTGRDRTGTLILKVDTLAADGTIVITDAPNGAFKIVIDKDNARLFPKSNGIWDIWRIPVSGEPDLLLKGTWIAEESATDWDTFV